MNEYSLPLFPEDSTSITITTTVWIGVVVVAFFNLRLGWTLSGLVAPGYLVPLLMIKPISVAVIMLEATVAYGIVWSISELLNRRPNWSSLFGRDRFFALVLASVFTRVTLDGWIWPWLGNLINDRFSLNLDHQNHMHTYGLIIVSLIANYFWKPGLIRGMPPFITSIGLTYLLVRFVLVELTNFNFGALHYMYEDIASSLLASPKSYILLLTTAYIASWMNLRYSWEFNGILIPALLALQWHHPLKILASFIEALVVLIAATLILRAPIWKKTTMAGARKLLFFFTLAFVYRLLLAWWLPVIATGFKVTDAFGFGYLLSTLLAIRFHDRQQVTRITWATVQVALVGGVAGSLMGFTLTLWPGPWQNTLQASVERNSLVIECDEELVHLVRQGKLLLYQSRSQVTYRRPFQQELYWFTAGLRDLQQYIRYRRQDQLLQSAKMLERANYQVRLVRNRYVFLREYSPPRGWGLFVLDIDRPDGIVIDVPAPLDEALTLEAGLSLFHHMQGTGVAVAGTARRQSDDQTSDVLTNPTTIYSRFLQVFGRGRGLQVRGYTRSYVQKHRGVSRQDANQAIQSMGNSLWVKRRLPIGLNLRELKDIVGKFEVRWESRKSKNVTRSSNWAGFAELLLNRSSRHELTSRLVVHGRRAGINTRLEHVEGDISNWLLVRKDQLARRGTDTVAPARVEELLFFDEEVLRPIAPLVTADDWNSERVPRQLDTVAASAGMLNYRLISFRDSTSGDDFLVLTSEPASDKKGLPPLSAPRRCWGTYVFRRGAGAQPYVVEVPRPLYERNSLEFGVSLFVKTRAAALFIAGAHPYANRDGSADVSRPVNKVSLFNLMHQAYLREAGSRPMVVVQSRAIQDPVDAQVVIAADDGSTSLDELTPLKRNLVELLTHFGMTWRFVDGSPSTAGYEHGNTAQTAALRLALNKESLTFWLSPSLRTVYRQQLENRQLRAQMFTLGIDTREASLIDHLETMELVGQTDPPDQVLLDRVGLYLKNQDIVCLRQLQQTPGVSRLELLIDTSTQIAFLLIWREVDVYPFVVNLSGPLRSQPRVVVSHGFERRKARFFVDSRATWLEIRSAQ